MDGKYAIQDGKCAIQKDWNIHFLRGLSAGELEVLHQHIVELHVYERPDGQQLFVFTGLGGGRGGFTTFKRQKNCQSRKRYKGKGLKWTISLSQAQDDLDSYADQHGFNLVTTSTHPEVRCVVDETQEPRKFALKALAPTLSFAEYASLRGLGLDFGSYKLKHTQDPSMNEFFGIVLTAIRTDMPVSEKALRSIVESSLELISENSSKRTLGDELLSMVRHYHRLAGGVGVNTHKPGVGLTWIAKGVMAMDAKQERHWWHVCDILKRVHCLLEERAQTRSKIPASFETKAQVRNISQGWLPGLAR